jgi:hypothetical protein
MTRILVFLTALLVGTVAYASGPQQDVRDSEAFLEQTPYQDRPYIKFFSVSNIPTLETIKLPNIKDVTIKEIGTRQATEHVLNFTVHSLSSLKTLSRVKRVRGSDIFYADIRDYGWTEEAWDKISQNDPYYREPWIVYGPPEHHYHYKLHANYIVRADWFIAHLMDATKQFDVDREPLYYQLLYAGNKTPTTIEEFRAFWGFGVDAEKEAKKFQLLEGTNVNHKESGVARHNRQLARIRTNRGYYHETSDVKNNQKERNYIENLEPQVIARKVRDAGEAIASNPVGLQVYFLTDGKGKRVEFGDPTVVVDWIDKQDARVRTARSCIICHSEGLNPVIPAFRKMLERDNVELRTYNKEYKEEIENFYLSELGVLIKEDNEFYARVMLKINGLTPDMNSFLFKRIMERYEESVSLERAAEECGLTVTDFVTKCTPTASGMLGDLLGTGKRKISQPVPRESWDDFEGGVFSQAMILSYNIRPATKDNKKVQLTKLRVIYKTQLRLGTDVLAEVPAGVAFEVIKEKDGWFFVNYKKADGTPIQGYLYKDFVQLEHGE